MEKGRGLGGCGWRMNGGRVRMYVLSLELVSMSMPGSDLGSVSGTVLAFVWLTVSKTGLLMPGFSS